MQAPLRLQIFDTFIEFIITLVLVISPFLFGSGAPFSVLALNLAASSILFLWVVKSVTAGSFEFAKLPANLPILIFLIFIAAQYFLIHFIIPGFSMGAVYRYKMKAEILQLVSYLIFFYAVINVLWERKSLNRLAQILITAGFVLAFFGITQKLVQPKTAVSFAFFPNRNHFAAYINIISLIGFGVLFSRFSLLRDYIKTMDKASIAKGLLVMFQEGLWFYIFALIVMTSSLFYSLSRGGIFSFCFGLLFFFVFTIYKRITRRGHVFLFVILALTLGMLLWINAPEQLSERFTKGIGEGPSLVNRLLGERFIMAKNAVRLVKDYPLFGVGFGAFQFIYNKNYSPNLIWAFDIHYYIDHIHNDFLELLCEVGLIGFILFIIVVYLYVGGVLRTFLKRNDPFSTGLGAGAIAGLFSMSLHSFFDFNFHITANAVLFFVMAGLTVGVINSRVTEKGEVSLLSKAGPFKIDNLYVRILLVLAASAAFLFIVTGIITPYAAYRLSRDGKTLASFREAIRLDSASDRNHFLFAQFFIEKARKDARHKRQYVGLASREIKEAIRLNPWNKQYPEYLDWISNIWPEKKNTMSS
ncbi:MAG: O-antigen ligase family protein [Candidatus Omnitrophica bacterium]|nr:O-antigen ligase family protein [Candidatus Omnitrophota bacterium]